MPSRRTTRTILEEPAPIEALLAYAAKHPDEQRQYPIIGLGSVAGVGGDRYVPYLRRHGARRYLLLSWWDDGWHDFYRFLAVRKLGLGPSEAKDCALGLLETWSLLSGVLPSQNAGFLFGILEND